MTPQFDIDVILPTRDRSMLIAPTLDSLCALNYPAFHIYVVDQSTGTETAQIVQRYVDRDNRVTLLPMQAKGLDKARNHGIRAGNAAIVAFTDDDCRVTPDWLEAMAAEYEQDQGLWGVFGKVVPGESEGESGAATSSAAVKNESQQGEHADLARILPMAMKTADQRTVYEKNRFNLGFGHGANMSFRRTTFERAGLFDDLLGTGSPLRSWPERDLGYRILSLGGRIVYTPQAMVYHHHWRGWAEVKRTYRNYAIGAGAATGKYLRCGDWGGLYLLLEWILDQGVRQVFSGLIKWRSWQKTYVGLLQMVYPWVGLVEGLRYPVDCQARVYRERAVQREP